ncbi:MAG TPA: hypothetical protein VKP59_00235, partial [Candidatus Thermoplasmatota archaeon]|nr:hypothetical protein [Candidatus Thermoplasmatota archaeon]
MRLSKFVIITLCVTVFLVISSYMPLVQSFENQNPLDIDPLVDLTVTFELLKIRSLEKYDNHLNFREYIDRYSYPDFYLKVWINDELFQSPVWKNTRYIY